VIYLTPVFPARSTHRYDATTFERVDPLLGGDAALESLAEAAQARGIRLLGDLTTNHCGDGHEWFLEAQAAPDAPERELFYFDETNPNGYESWLDIPVLPKLDWRSHELRRRMAAVAQRWLEAGLAGWRIDVANMTGRFRDIDVNADAARTIRAAVDAARPDGVVVAEHFHDFREDLVPGGWHGVMNYSGFLKPAWMWLVGDDPGSELRRRFHDLLVPLPRIGGGAAVDAMRAFRAGVAWPATLHSWPLLDSHDTARFRTVAGTRDGQAVGIGLQMTTPGVPMVFAGDELGLEGEWGEDARRTMPWNRDESWDTELLEGYRRLISLRRSSRALSRGGIRYVHLSADALAYLREASGETVLCLAARAPHEPVRVPLAALGGEPETLVGNDASNEDDSAVLPSAGPAFHAWRVTTREGNG
jgi:alpha-glucosidase